MNNNKLKIGFIGGGVNSAVGYAHYCASHLDGHFELVCGAFSRNPEINKETAQKYGLTERVYDDWQTLIAQEANAIDAVVILTPTPAHNLMLEACIKNNLAVICEKAITTDSAGCLHLSELAKQNNSFVAVTYNYSGYPMVREIKSLVASGKLGKIHHIQVEMPQEGFARLLKDGAKPNPQYWRLHDEAIPTIYLDLAVHLHHLVYYTTGLNPIETIAQQHSYGWFNDVIDDVSAIVDYQDNVKCQYWFSKSSLGHRNGLRIKVYGSNAAVEWQQTQPELLTMSHINGRTEIIERGSDCEIAELTRYNRFKAGHPAGFIEAFANLYADFSEAIKAHRNGEFHSVMQDYSLTISHQGLNLLEAMVRSCQSRQWEKVENDV